nr:MAG TPA: hypothetical protein [Caudoviricetes sp.]DAU73830.1 MAG TPA: hypothetical protein [Caudoviricetes sp.]
MIQWTRLIWRQLQGRRYINFGHRGAGRAEPMKKIMAPGADTRGVSAEEKQAICLSGTGQRSAER